MAAGEWTYTVSREAQSEIASLPEDLAEEAIDVIEALCYDPFPPDSIELRRNNNVRRVAFGNDAYRIVYRVNVRRR